PNAQTPARGRWLLSGDARGRCPLLVGERDQRLELVTARFAFPEMPHALPVEILGPFRQEDCLPALGTVIQQSGPSVFPGARGSELHDASSAMLPLPEAGHASAIPAAMKQERCPTAAFPDRGGLDAVTLGAARSSGCEWQPPRHLDLARAECGTAWQFTGLTHERWDGRCSEEAPRPQRTMCTQSSVCCVPRRACAAGCGSFSPDRKSVV